MQLLPLETMFHADPHQMNGDVMQPGRCVRSGHTR